MDHPNIARVLDAGETSSGRPHFVMELVRGVPITDYCAQNRLTTSERLELFAHVCQAVQHAHHKGIIHRDLKPSNVMVTLHDGAPVVKVIDFGIAKALGQQLTDKTLYTGFARMIGTPMYMSPEQAQLSGLDIDTRSDIFSLGVLLYELLAGVTPFDKERLHTAGYDEMRRIIREEEPPTPSTRLITLGEAAVTVSAQRQSDPKRLSQLLRGELDWIVMKRRSKRTAARGRYETANELAADVEPLPARRAGGCLPAVGMVSLRQVHATAQDGAADRRGGSPGVGAGDRRRQLGAVGPGNASKRAVRAQGRDGTDRERGVGHHGEAARPGEQDAEAYQRRGGSNRGGDAASGCSAGPGAERLADGNGRRPSASAGVRRARTA